MAQPELSHWKECHNGTPPFSNLGCGCGDFFTRGACERPRLVSCLFFGSRAIHTVNSRTESWAFRDSGGEGQVFCCPLLDKSPNGAFKHPA